MSDPSNNRKREDAAKKRRDYLLKLASAYSRIIGVVVTTVAILLLFGFGVNAVWQKMLNTDVIGALVMLVLFLPLPLAVLILSMRSVRYKMNAAKTIPYVPRVPEQIALLPAEGLLLRGSVQPIAAPAELLRRSPRRWWIRRAALRPRSES